VVRDRAEDAETTVGAADVVTARAVAPLGKLCRWAAPLLAPGGRLVAIKGRSAADEIDRDARAAARAGITGLTVRSLRCAPGVEATTVIVGSRRGT
jgi:16S rRNA (guanine527-N7)-methyltransferase